MSHPSDSTPDAADARESIAGDPTPITIVSGLPRSGTSLMMQMLVAGGMEALADDVRAPDESNPRGYLELERVKSLARDSSWISEARGKALKVITQLVPALPGGERYRVILMVRALDEVIASQNALLTRTGQNPGELTGERLAAVFERQTARVHTRLREAGTPCLVVRYAETLASPERIASRVAAFLGSGVDTERMAASVDRSLYRARSQASAS